MSDASPILGLWTTSGPMEQKRRPENEASESDDEDVLEDDADEGNASKVLRVGDFVTLSESTACNGNTVFAAAADSLARDKREIENRWASRTHTFRALGFLTSICEQAIDSDELARSARLRERQRPTTSRDVQFYVRCFEFGRDECRGFGRSKEFWRATGHARVVGPLDRPNRT